VNKSPFGYPTAIYNAMIYPLLDINIKGVIWYQGESNAGRAEEYAQLFPAMINGWRKAFNQGDFPFYFVQLANFDLEDEKQVILESLKNRIDFALNMEKLSKIFKPNPQSITFQFEELVAAKKLPFRKEDTFRYAIWGVALPNSYQLFDSLCTQFPNSKMITAIDTYCTGTYRDDIPIITPSEISGLPYDVIILVIAPAAHKAAVELLSGMKRPFALIKGASVELFNIGDKV
jgi:hypothetical protein